MKPKKKTPEEIYKLLHPTKKELARAVKEHREAVIEHEYKSEEIKDWNG